MEINILWVAHLRYLLVKKGISLGETVIVLDCCAWTLCRVLVLTEWTLPFWKISFRRQGFNDWSLWEHQNRHDEVIRTNHLRHFRDISNKMNVYVLGFLSISHYEVMLCGMMQSDVIDSYANKHSKARVFGRAGYARDKATNHTAKTESNCVIDSLLHTEP